MARTLRQWAQERGLDEHDLARDLSLYLDTEVTPADVRTRWGRQKPTQKWLAALGVELDPPEPEPDRQGAGDDGPGRQPRQPRTRDAEADTPPATTPVLPLDANLAVLHGRIAGLYVLAGKGAAAAAKNAQYAVAFEQHANQAADAWCELARQDARVAQVLNGLMVGGPWSGVIWCHLSLGMSLVVISGKFTLPAFPVGTPRPEPAPAAASSTTSTNGGEPGGPDAPPGVVGEAREQAGS